MQCFLAHTDAAGNVTWATFCSTLPYMTGTSVAVSGKTLVVAGTLGVALAVPFYPFVSALPGNQPPLGTQPQVFVQEYALP